MRGDRAERLEITVTVGRQEGDAVACADAYGLEPCREPLAAIMKLAVLQPDVAIYDGNLLGMKTARMFDWIGEGEQTSLSFRSGANVDDDIAE